MRSAAQLLAALLLCTFTPTHAQLEVSWAYTVEGIFPPWGEIQKDGGNSSVDPWGNLAVCGYGFEDVTMNGSGTPVLATDHHGGGDGFVGRYRSDGTPSWGFWLGSPVLDAATGVAMDNEGNVYLSMFFEGAFDMDPGPDSAMIAPADGNRDLVIIKYDSTGQFLHAIHLVAEYYSSAGQIGRMAFDADNNLYIAGIFQTQMDVDPGPGQVILTGNGHANGAFVAKYSPQGQLLDHLALVSSENRSGLFDLVLDPDGSFFIAGIFSVELDLDRGPGSMLLQTTGRSGFGAHFNADFSPHWGLVVDASQGSYAFAACAGTDGGYILNGQFNGMLTVTLTDGTQQVMVGGSQEYSTFLAGLNADGEYTWFKQFEVAQRGDFQNLAAKNDSTFYGGFHYFGDFNLDPGGGNFTVSTPGFPNWDMGIARYGNSDGEFLLGHSYSDEPNQFLYDWNHVQVLGSALYMCGGYSGSLHPDIPQGTNVLTPGGMAVIKYCHLPENLSYSVEDTLTVCPGAAAVLVAYGAEQFRWFTSEEGGTPIAVNDSLQLDRVEGTITVWVEGVNGTCVSQRVPLTVLVRPQVSLSANTISVCTGDSLLLSYTGLADTFTPSLPEAFSTGYVPTTDMYIWVTATDLNGCVAADTAFVQVLPLPSVALQLSPDTICAFDFPTLLAGGSPAGGVWDGAGVENDSLWTSSGIGPGVYPVSYTITGANGCTATATDNMVMIVCTVGIAENELKVSITLYPVPASSWIEVKSTGGDVPNSVTVLDAQGRIVLQQKMASSFQRIDVSGLATGRYVMRVELIDQAASGISSVIERVFMVVRDR